ncbi:MAG: hypothetical protein QW103_01745 [Candidatus Pacearchaeota archaeon]
MVKEKATAFVKEFKDFLKEYKVIGLGIAVMMSLAANTFVKSFVDK